MSHAPGSSCCEPTWKATPSARNPDREASVSNPTASSGAHPNLCPNGVTDDGNVGAMRHSTLDPGAFSAIAARPAAVSKVNRRTPCANAYAISAGFLSGLPNVIRAPSMPAAAHRSISPTDATSNVQSRPARSRSTGSAGLALTAYRTSAAGSAPRNSATLLHTVARSIVR